VYTPTGARGWMLASPTEVILTDALATKPIAPRGKRSIDERLKRNSGVYFDVHNFVYGAFSFSRNISNISAIESSD